jgi:hypothetical protein
MRQETTVYSFFWMLCVDSRFARESVGRSVLASDWWKKSQIRYPAVHASSSSSFTFLIVSFHTVEIVSEKEMESSIKILVSDAQKQYKKDLSFHVDYKVEVTKDDNSTQVRRRFKDFAFLSSLMEAKLSGAILPILPDKGINTQFANKSGLDEDFVEARGKVWYLPLFLYRI